MKRTISVLLALILCLSVCAVNASAAEDGQKELVVGTLTQMSGNFFSSLFGNNTSDLDVRQLLHAYSLVQWDGAAGAFTFNKTVVNGSAVKQNSQGDRTYVLALNEGLQYSDGSPITAWDYAFAFLFHTSPEAAQLGGAVEQYRSILGAKEYAADESNVLTGVHVMSDYLLSVTLDHEYLPFFYELGLLDMTPVPISEIAPECKLADDDEGVYLVGQNRFTVENIRENVERYLSLPDVVSGAYRIVSFDGTEAVFERNPYFRGDAGFQAPEFDRITFRYVTSDEALAQLASGEMQLLNKAVSAETVDGGMELARGEGHPISMVSYPRRGLSLVNFCMESKKVQSSAVRKALYMCMDREALTTGYTGGYGMPAQGYWGIGQWVYQAVTGMAEHAGNMGVEAAKYGLNLDSVPVYELDIEAAKQLLIADGWTKNESGADYVEGKDAVRCRETEGKLEKLELELVYPETSAMAGLFEQYWLTNLAQAGIKVTLHAEPMNELLKMYYRQAERDCDMIYLATNFAVVFDASVSYAPDAQVVNNPGGFVDERLYELAVALRNTEPGQTGEYCAKWLDFEEYWMEVLPGLPVYCNEYFDFYTAQLQNYAVSAQNTWSQAILNARLSDTVEAGNGVTVIGH